METSTAARLGSTSFGQAKSPRSANFPSGVQSQYGLGLSNTGSNLPSATSPRTPSPYTQTRIASHKRTSSEPTASSEGIGSSIRGGIDALWRVASPRLASVAEFATGSSGSTTQNGPSSTSKRSFYRDDHSTAAPRSLPSHFLTGGRSNVASGPSGVTETARAIILRPFLLLSRRGPLLPISLILFIIFLMGGFSSKSAEDAAALAEDAQYTSYIRGQFNKTNPLYRHRGSNRAAGRMERFMQAADDYIPERAKSFIPDRAKDLVYWVAYGTGSTAAPDVEEDVGMEDPIWLPRKIRMERAAQHHAVVPETGPALGDEDDELNSIRHPHSKPRLARRDGRALIIEGQEHPIPGLMKRAKRRWENLKARQSKTFSQAVKEYVRRYGRRPPKGFDRWYAFAKANNVKMIDEFDLIERDLHIYRAFSPSSLARRVEWMRENVDWTWGVRITDGKFSREGQLADHDRARGVEDLVRNFIHELPDMLIWYNGHDIARVMVPWEERDRLEQLIETGQYDDDAEDLTPKAKGPFPYWGMAQLCSPDSAVRDSSFEYGQASREWTGFEMPSLPTDEHGGKVVGTVIDSFKAYMDICNSPQYRHYHTASSYVFPHHPTPLVPLFTPGVQGNFPDVHSLIVEQFDFEAPHDPTWEERPFDRVVWRGQTSGPQWDKGSPWMSSHRARLHLLSHAETGSRDIVLALPQAEDTKRLTPRQKKLAAAMPKQSIAKKVEVPNYRLNPLFLDVGMVGPAVQCIKEDGTCDEMFKVFQGYETRLSFDRSNLYKYVLDVDGNSWSGRFRRLMASHAAVIKTTLYPEFWTDWCMPWLHFIPVQIDYSDLWDVLAFFRGGLMGEGSHDDLAKEIATAGRDWAKTYFRWQDLEAYQFRLMLEYGRLWNQKDGDYDFVAKDDDLLEEPVWDKAASMKVAQTVDEPLVREEDEDSDER